MPRFIEATADAMSRLVNVGTGYRYRQAYRDAIGGLKPGATIEITPEGDEGVRRLKVNVTRAATEVQATIAYGETTDGTLLVWLKEEKKHKVAA